MKSYVLVFCLNSLYTGNSMMMKTCLQIDDESYGRQMTSDGKKFGSFARECKFAKYQANKANGSKEKRIVPIEDSNSKALVAKDSQGEIDWTKEFDDDPVTFAIVALNGIEEDDWSMEIDADHVDLDKMDLEFLTGAKKLAKHQLLCFDATSSTDSSNSE
ncbi:hypothetical protein Tco_0990272 [Tanacetum coccineum]|uniref:Uncharacterized protein n=1 Tax=Tanacetum coccineum TaxID=301880 RepID=A0ABQ5EWT0_9ASTR